MRRLLIDSAAAELLKLPFIDILNGTSQKYGDNCRLGHTFEGSFGFTIESPVGPNTETKEQLVTPPPPFERRVVERVARGLSYVESAEDEASPVPLLDTFERGFNANMYDRFAELMEGTTASTLSFKFSFSPAWPVSDELRARETKISAAAIPIMREAAKTLRRVEEPGPIVIEGIVFRLESSGNPSDLLHPIGSREIIVRADNLASGVVNVPMRLLPVDYLVAVRAHETGRRVRVVGNLRRLGPRTLELQGPSDFTILD
jgi:hypothetical protein